MVFGKKHKKNIMGLAVSGVALGVGSQAISKVGGNAAPIATLSSHMPLVGNVMGAGMAMDAMQGLRPKKKKR